MKIIFIIAFLVQNSSWKVENVETDNKIYTVHVKKHIQSDSTSGNLHKIYRTDIVKSPEKLGIN